MKIHTITKKLSALGLGISLIAAYTHCGFAQGNLVFNGGFDVDSAGWTPQNIGAGGGYRPDKGSPAGFYLLDSSTPSALNDPSISQAISGLVPGTTYALSGSYQYSIDRGGGVVTDPSFGVAIDSLFLFTAAKPSLLQQNEWLGFTVFFTPTSTSAILSLSAQLNGTGVSYGVDNISITQVPEPSLVSLLSCAFFLRLVRRNYQNNLR